MRGGEEKENDEWEMRIQNKKGRIGENIEGKEERNGLSRKNKRKRRKELFQILIIFRMSLC